MDERKEVCDTSEGAMQLTKELAAHMESCQDKQRDTTARLQQICNSLHSNSLVEMHAQVVQETEQVQAEVNQCRAELQTLHANLIQIESEKDREMRLKKQRE